MEWWQIFLDVTGQIAYWFLMNIVLGIPKLIAFLLAHLSNFFYLLTQEKLQEVADTFTQAGILAGVLLVISRYWLHATIVAILISIAVWAIKKYNKTRFWPNH